MRQGLLFLLLTTLVGCADIAPQTLKSAGSLGARLVLKDPVDGKCRDAGLAECADVTEGILLFVERNPSEGKERLRIAAAANSPENLKLFARALVAIGDLPGTASYLGSVLDAARFLDDSETHQMPGSRHAGASDSTPRGGRTDSPHAPDQSEAESLADGMVVPLQNPAAQPCGAGGLTFSCARAVTGPIVLTGLFEMGQCSDGAVAMAAQPGGDLGAPRWAIPLNPTHTAFIGIKLTIHEGEALFIGVQTPPPSKAASQCAVTWTGLKLAASPAMSLLVRHQRLRLRGGVTAHRS